MTRSMVTAAMIHFMVMQGTICLMVVTEMIILTEAQETIPSSEGMVMTSTYSEEDTVRISLTNQAETVQMTE